jgi:hypothetical protein
VVPGDLAGEIYVRPDSQLWITTLAPRDICSLVIGMRYQHVKGGQQIGAESIVVPLSSSPVVQRFPFPEGWLLSLIIRTSGNIIGPGSVWVEVQLAQGQGAQGVPYAGLISGYAHTYRALVYPPPRHEIPEAGPGAARDLLSADPAAGAELSFGPTSALRWLVGGARFMLVTDATVITRRVNVQLRDPGGGIVWRVPASVSQGAGFTYGYNVVPSSYAQIAGIDEITVPVGERPLVRSGWLLETFTNNLQAGDNFGPMRVFAEEWLSI